MYRCQYLVWRYLELVINGFVTRGTPWTQDNQIESTTITVFVGPLLRR